jgi:hypothetical protein
VTFFFWPFEYTALASYNPVTRINGSGAWVADRSRLLSSGSMTARLVMLRRGMIPPFELTSSVVTSRPVVGKQTRKLINDHG